MSVIIKQHINATNITDTKCVVLGIVIGIGIGIGIDIGIGSGIGTWTGCPIPSKCNNHIHIIINSNTDINTATIMQ